METWAAGAAADPARHRSSHHSMPINGFWCILATAKSSFPILTCTFSDRSIYPSPVSPKKRVRYLLRTHTWPCWPPCPPIAMSSYYMYWRLMQIIGAPIWQTGRFDETVDSSTKVVQPSSDQLRLKSIRYLLDIAFDYLMSFPFCPFYCVHAYL